MSASWRHIEIDDHGTIGALRPNSDEGRGRFEEHVAAPEPGGIYARAAAWIAGADRWPEARWADLEAQLGLAKQDGPEAGPAMAPSGPTRTMPRRRTVRSNYMR